MGKGRKRGKVPRKEVGKEAGKGVGKVPGKEVGKEAGKIPAKEAGKVPRKEAGKEAGKVPGKWAREGSREDSGEGSGEGSWEGSGEAEVGYREVGGGYTRWDSHPPTTARRGSGRPPVMEVTGVAGCDCHPSHAGGVLQGQSVPTGGGQWLAGQTRDHYDGRYLGVI